MESEQFVLHPLVFKVANARELGFAAESGGGVRVITAARALGGMQKEGLVHYGPTGACWRMVTDEGPYLNGTDLAPFPLAFFSTGMASSYMSEIQALARARGIGIDGIELVQDNFYSMEGSALLGTMTGGALPVELSVQIRSLAPREELLRLVQHAIAASPADALLRSVLKSEFTLRRNGNVIPVTRVPAVGGAPAADPEPIFARVRRSASDTYAGDIIVKLEGAQTRHGVEGGAGSSLQAEQKRTLHVRAVCTLRDDGLKQVRIQLFKPIGSTFQFLADDPEPFGGRDRAPDGLAYLSAGIAFCYMTQIGRYAHIVKQKLDSYRIVQHTRFSLPGASGGTGVEATAAPAQTHVCVTTSEPDDNAQMLVKMGEQTCFLHAACRTKLKTRIRLAEPAAAA